MKKTVFTIKSQRVKEMTHRVREDLSLKPRIPLKKLWVATHTVWHDAFLNTNKGAMETEKLQEKNVWGCHFQVSAQWLPDHGWMLELLTQLPNSIRGR